MCTLLKLTEMLGVCTYAFENYKQGPCFLFLAGAIKSNVSLPEIVIPPPPPPDVVQKQNKSQSGYACLCEFIFCIYLKPNPCYLIRG